jgi:competence protein CoiA
MSNTIKIAIHKPTEQFIHVDNIESTDKETRNHCYCLMCDEKLEAVLEFKDKNRIKFFRHNKNPNCEGSQETALHELAKQILVENIHISIRDHGTVTYSNAIAEKRFEKIRPDVSAKYKEQPIFFEIYVSHAVDSGKEKFFIDGKFKSVEINLSNCTASSFDEIKKMVLEQTELQTVFYWSDETLIETKSVKESDDNWILQLIKGAIVALIFIKIVNFFTKKRNR